MSFCSNCGAQLAKDAKFCHQCGHEVITGESSEDDTKKSLNDDNENKCPNCGAPVKSFLGSCQYCGYEFSNKTAPDSLKVFSEEVMRIEEARKSRGVFGVLASRIGSGDASTSKLESLIRTYSVPNNKADIIEFLILSISNIDPGAYSDSRDTSRTVISDAWISKTDQVYQKALLTLGNDIEFDSVKRMYETKMKEVAKAKRQPMYQLLLSAALCIFIYIFLFLLIKH